MSPLERINLLTREIDGMLAALDIDIVGRETAKTIKLLRQLLVDARLDVRDYELAESRAEQSENARAARRRLERLRAQLLKASEHGIFNAIDIMRLSVQLDEVADGLAA